jgi:hypothetical protein
MPDQMIESGPHTLCLESCSLMFLRTARLVFVVVIFSFLVSACGGRGSSAPPPVGGLTVAPGDGQVVISWTADPGVEYWLWYVPGTSISSDSPTATPGHRSIIRVTSPYVLAGLTNGADYAFTLNGRYDGGPGGSGTPSVTAKPRPAGTTWVAGGTMGSADMRGLAYGAASNGTTYFVSVGASGALYQSSDGVTSSALNWSLISGSGITSNLNAAVYAKSTFIAVGNTGSAYYSTDTLTWTTATSVSAQNLNAVASNGSQVVAVGNAGAIQYSADGVTWYAAASVPTTNALYGVAWGSVGWVAVGAGGTLLTSTDGSNWGLLTSGTTVDLKAVAFRAATTTYPTASYVVVGLGGLVLTSSNAAVSWTAQTLSPASDLLAITPMTSQILAVGAGGAAFTSPDGVVWTSQTTGTGSTLYGLINAQAQYVAVGQSGLSLYSR